MKKPGIHLIVLSIVLCAGTTFLVHSANALIIVEEDSYSFTVYRGFEQTETILIKNDGPSATFTFELNDTRGKLSTFDYADVDASSLLISEDEIIGLNVSFSVPDHVNTETMKMDLLIKYSNAIVNTIPITIQVSEKTHCLEIDNITFNKDSYNTGELGVAEVLVTNKGTRDESVKIMRKVSSGREAESAISHPIPAGASRMLETEFIVPDVSSSQKVSLLITVFNDYEHTSSKYVSATYTSYFQVDVPELKFIFKLDPRGGIITEAGEMIERTILLTNTGNVEDAYEVSVDYPNSTLSEDLVTLQPGERAELELTLPALKQFEGDKTDVSVNVCSVTTRECKTDSLTLMIIAGEEEEAEVVSGSLSVLPLGTEKTVEKARAVVYTIRIFNNDSQPRNVIIDAEDFGSMSIKVLPSSELVVPALQEEEVYVYVTTSPHTSAGEHVFSLAVLCDGETIFEDAFKITVKEDNVLVTGFNVVLSEPIIYLIPVSLVFLLAIILYVRRRNNDDTTEVSDYEQYYQ